MSFLSGMDISASGLTAQRTRMDVITENIVNVDTTRTAEGGPYVRKGVVLEDRSEGFAGVLGRAMDGVGGVRVAAIVDDPSEHQRVYDPTHPDADEEGYVTMPNVDTAKEMVDLMGAYRSYEANVTAFQAYKDMALKTMEIGG